VLSLVWNSCILLPVVLLLSKTNKAFILSCVSFGTWLIVEFAEFSVFCLLQNGCVRPGWPQLDSVGHVCFMFVGHPSHTPHLAAK
jgi:hypothetical protein